VPLSAPIPCLSPDITVHKASISWRKLSSIVFIFPGPSIRMIATPSFTSTGAKYCPRVERLARFKKEGHRAVPVTGQKEDVMMAV
jgi:hypothetical protein